MFFRRGRVFQEYITGCVQAQWKVIERGTRRKVQYLYAWAYSE